MKVLEKYNINLKDLKGAVTALNAENILKKRIKFVAVKGEQILINFMDAVNGIPDDKLSTLPQEVLDFYEKIPQAAFDDAPTAETETEETEETEPSETEETEETEPSETEPSETEPSETVETVETEPSETEPSETVETVETVETEGSDSCPTFGGYNPKEKDCQACKSEFPDEFKECAKATKSKRHKAKKRKVKIEGKRSRYGHNINSMSAMVDDMLFIGGNIDDMAAQLGTAFDRSEQKARLKIRAHAGYLVKFKGLELNSKDGYLKIDTPYLKGFNKDNTKVSISAIPIHK